MPTTPYESLITFLAESNKIEGIFHVRPSEIDTAEKFLHLPSISIANVTNYVTVTAGAILRDKEGLDVRIGTYFPPRGGPELIDRYEKLIGWINRRQIAPYDAHREYEQLHPYTDGNGRSGRLIWLWQMKSAPLGFLHQWYYQSLRAANDNEPVSKVA